MDELASHFGLSSEEVVNRLETFIDEKLITGVFDDRGKFVYVTDEELQAGWNLSFRYQTLTWI